MKQLWHIIAWEYTRRFQSRSFLLATFFSPILFSMIILLPSIIYQNSNEEFAPVIGLVEYDSTGLSNRLIERFQEYSMQTAAEPNALQLIKVVADTPAYLKKRFQDVQIQNIELDSLNEAYIKIKERRKYIFRKPGTRSREKLLKETYEELKQTRESRDLAQLEYQRYRSKNDSIWRSEIVNKAEFLLSSEKISAYLILNNDRFIDGWFEMYSAMPRERLKSGIFKQALQNIVIEERMHVDEIQDAQIRSWLQPVEIRQIQAFGEDENDFDLLYNYVGPVIVVLFLFISIFTSSGFLFSGIIREKSNRIIEILISSVSHLQLISGKVIGLGALGLTQILIWFLMLAGISALNLLPVQQIEFLTLANAGLFVLYFVLGYLFFSTIFVGLGSLFSSEEDAHHLNQILRLMSIFPLVLALFILESPNALFVRILSFIPPLTPTFMILRIPLGHPPLIDYYLSIGILLLSILLGLFAAGRLFRAGSLSYGKHHQLREIFRLIFKGS